MRGISEKRLKAILHNQVLTPKTQSFIQYLIDDECQELQEPWMTLDEFLKSGFTGFCWIRQDDYIENSYFDGETFFESSTGSHCYQTYNITHVMPIHKPEPLR